jgi:hypothetical protein
MQFVPTSEPAATPPHRRESLAWFRVLVVAGLASALLTRWPWTRVAFERLFGAHDGPPAFHSTAGFTCLCASLLIVVVALAETGAPRAREAARAGSATLAGLALLVLAFRVAAGPGSVRGVSASWTPWLFAACASVAAMACACAYRYRLDRRRARGARASAADVQSSSGPPR